MTTGGAGVLPAGYILAIAFQNDTSGNITGASYSVTDPTGKKTTIGPVEIVGASLTYSGGQGTIPESAVSPMYGVQLNP